MPSQMPAPRWELESLLEPVGERGDWSLDGTLRVQAETLDGPRPWDSISWQPLSLTKDQEKDTTDSSETTWEWLKAGGEAEAATDPPTTFLSWWENSDSYLTPRSTLGTSNLLSIQQTTPQEASTAPSASYSQQQRSPAPLETLSWISTIPNSQSREAWQSKGQPPLPSKSLPETQLGRLIATPSIAKPRKLPLGLQDGKTTTKFNSPLPKPPPTSSSPAPYKPTLTPAPSLLRPHVIARLRLTSWIPHSAASIPPTNEQERVRQVLSAGWDESTLATYGTGLLTYHVFCDALSITEETRTPTSPSLLSSFIAALAGSYSASAIANYVASLKAWHVLNRLEWRPNEDEVRVLMRAAAKTTPASSKKPKRAPVTISIITAIHANLDPENPLHTAVYACLTAAFYATARLGEMTVPNLEAFNPSLHPTRDCLETIVDRTGIATTILHLPKTKTSQTGEDVHWTGQEGLSDPVAAMDKHLRLNNPPATAHTFAYPHGKTFRPLTKRNFMLVVNMAAKKAELSPLQGHGIRIGSTLEYLLRGLSFEAMRTKGRWASNAFSVYITKHAEILAQHTHLGDPQHPLSAQPALSRARTH